MLRITSAETWTRNTRDAAVVYAFCAATGAALTIVIGIIAGIAVFVVQQRVIIETTLLLAIVIGVFVVVIKRHRADANRLWNDVTKSVLRASGAQHVVGGRQLPAGRAVIIAVFYDRIVVIARDDWEQFSVGDIEEMTISDATSMIEGILAGECLLHVKAMRHSNDYAIPSRDRPFWQARVRTRSQSDAEVSKLA